MSNSDTLPYTPCPTWLKDMLLRDYSHQIIETANYDPSAISIIQRLMDGSNKIDSMIEPLSHFESEYGEGLYRGLLIAQSILQDTVDDLPL